MTYETLINSTVAKPDNKPNYTPAKSLKKALKAVRKFFKKSQKHQKFLNESMYEQESTTDHNMSIEFEEDYTSDEECENYANECREAAANIEAAN